MLRFHTWKLRQATVPLLCDQRNTAVMTYMCISFYLVLVLLWKTVLFVTMLGKDVWTLDLWHIIPNQLSYQGHMIWELLHPFPVKMRHCQTFGQCLLQSAQVQWNTLDNFLPRWAAQTIHPGRPPKCSILRGKCAALTRIQTSESKLNMWAIYQLSNRGCQIREKPPLCSAGYAVPAYILLRDFRGCFKFIDLVSYLPKGNTQYWLHCLDEMRLQEFLIQSVMTIMLRL